MFHSLGVCLFRDEIYGTFEPFLSVSTFFFITFLFPFFRLYVIIDLLAQQRKSKIIAQQQTFPIKIFFEEDNAKRSEKIIVMCW